MSELSASHWTARRLARMSRNAYHAGSRSGCFALDGPCQPAPGAFIGDGVGEVGHVLVPDPGWQRIDADQVQFVEVDWCLAVDAGVGCLEHDLSGLRADQPPPSAVMRDPRPSPSVHQVTLAAASPSRSSGRVLPWSMSSCRYAASTTAR
jgi:hypothetical protein